MSKRIMILLGIAFISIIAAFFLQKHELTEPEPEEETETEPEEATETETNKPAANVQEEATTGAEAGN